MPPYVCMYVGMYAHTLSKRRDVSSSTISVTDRQSDSQSVLVRSRRERKGRQTAEVVALHRRQAGRQAIDQAPASPLHCTSTPSIHAFLIYSQYSWREGLPEVEPFTV